MMCGASITLKFGQFIDCSYIKENCPFIYKHQLLKDWYHNYYSCSVHVHIFCCHAVPKVIYIKYNKQYAYALARPDSPLPPPLLGVIGLLD